MALNKLPRTLLISGASDAPLSDDKLAQEGLFQFPTVIGGVVLAINLPGVKSGELVLDGKNPGDIYLGKIKKWDDEAIAKLNPGPEAAFSETSPWFAARMVPVPLSCSPATWQK
ncbi:phosphate ABC transporter substrate-binding protein, PhoT family (TC 3.A.1.7.1) [Enterobacter asburiae]|uniref:Phosphate ABC transporter substrate-binding protein, PhoT family (TC 3.A.1.7.1) n=1 Tax=Enterobacter asburiae TaxID=61645 RepID=A0A376FHN0_ENTAS|nr:phosphate ABC transporter substrate-binding protein, PhoT family (TC 3.A.1.7.1) [Enterobacter asburiae]